MTRRKSARPAHISIAEFYDRLQRENELLLLDVRHEAAFQSGRIEARHTPETQHLPYINFVVDEAKAISQVPANREVIVVCAVGGSSEFVAGILCQAGLTAVNLQGGMAAWSKHYVFRPVEENESYQLYQVDRVARGCLSYVLTSQGQAMIVDPLRHIEQYQQFLAAKGAALELVIDTHAHADHISGGPALAAAHNVPYYLHPYDAIHPLDMLPTKLPYAMLQDGQKFTLGSLSVAVLHRPGHTLGQVNLLASNSSGACYLLTGDMIFLNGFGRPDLGGQTAGWAQLAYDTLFSKFKKDVPADAWILPGHYAGFDEANEAGVFVKKMETLWQQNPCLHFDSEASFCGYAENYAAEVPTCYIDIKRINSGLLNANKARLEELEQGKNLCALLTH